MLKRFLLALILMPFAFAGFAAQLTATLQSGDKVTPFYGSNAFKDALEAAVDGDIITLSAGNFSVSEVTKSVSIIGVYAFSTDAAKMTQISSLTVSANNVTLEGIRFSYKLTINGTENLTINRCYVATLEDSANHNNTIVTDCLIDCYNAMSLSKNTVIRNCCINYFWDTNNSSNVALIENCNIPLFRVTESSIAQPYAIYRNCLLGLYKHLQNGYAYILDLSSPSEFHSVNFYSNYNSSGQTSSYTVPWTINYGSCITDNVKQTGAKYFVTTNSSSFHYNSFESYSASGITVGPQDHKEYPSVPVISSSEIDAKTDAEGLLHVKISATARD